MNYLGGALAQGYKDIFFIKKTMIFNINYVVIWD